ncbi:MAG: hypothetical protein IJ549_04120 [Prevotella sp.]|nr:hypothetical protein [Prevotella sp.]
MKKTYIAPTMTATPVQMTGMICASLKSNVEFKYGGGTSNIDDFDPADIRSKRDNESSLWYDWNDIDEEE